MSRLWAIAALVVILSLAGCSGKGGALLVPSTPGGSTAGPANGSGGEGPAPAATPVPSSWELGNLPGTIPPKPDNVAERLKKLDEQTAGGKSASFINQDLNLASPFGMHTLTASGQYGSQTYYSYLTSDNPVTPVFVETFDAQHLDPGFTELHVWGKVNVSGIQSMIYAEIGLVTEQTYVFAMDPNGDGNQSDAVPSYMFNQNVCMLNALIGGNVAVPLDFNGTAGRGGTSLAFGNNYNFDLMLQPNQAAGGTGGQCRLRVRAPVGPWSGYTPWFNYGTDNWGWRPREDFSQSLLIAQLYSYNSAGAVGTLTFQYVRATQGPIPDPMIDCRSLPNALFSMLRPNGSTLAGPLDTDAVYDALPQLHLGDQFYLSFAVDPAQVNDRALYPPVPVAGLVTYTTTGLILDPVLTPYYDVDLVNDPFTLRLRPGVYYRVQNDLRSLSWANYSLETTAVPAVTICGPLPTSSSGTDRVILLAGVQYRPRYAPLTYPTAGSNAAFNGFREEINPVTWMTGWIEIGGVGANTIFEAGTVLGNYYDQAVIPGPPVLLRNTLQADAFCRFETRCLGWPPVPPGPTYSFWDMSAGAWLLPAGQLNPFARPYDVMTFARGYNFQLRTTDACNTLTITVDPGRLLNDGSGGVTDLPFTASATPPPPTHSGLFHVLPVRVWDDPALLDPGDPGTVVRLGPPLRWNVTVNFLLQYGAPNYAVELDADWGGAWNDGPAGRVYTVPGSPYAAPGLYSSVVVVNNQPGGLYTFAIRVTDSAGAQYIYVWPNQVNLPQPPQIDATTLTNARFRLRRSNNSFITGNQTTNTVYDASAVINYGNQFYVSLATDPAASPNDLVLYPFRPDFYVNPGSGPGTAALVTFTAAGMQIPLSLQPWFDTTDNGFTLHLKAGAYNRITNDYRQLTDTFYTLMDVITPATIGGPYDVDISNNRTVVFSDDTQYRPVFTPDAYPLAGSNAAFNGSPETIYPQEITTGYVEVGSATLTGNGTGPGGTPYAAYFTQAGLVNTLTSDGYCRFETWPGVGLLGNYNFWDTSGPSLITAPPGLDPSARPPDVLSFAQGVSFQVENGGFYTVNVSVDPGRLLNGVSSLNLALGLGSIRLDVIPLRVWDDPAQPDPGGPGTITNTGAGYNVTLYFLNQYGFANFTVQLDGDYDGTWDSPPAGRVYNVSPAGGYANKGLKTQTVTIPYANQPPGTYTFALRITDSAASQYTYVWPTPVTLGGWYSLTIDGAAANLGQMTSLRVVSGNPAISYYDVTNTNLVFIRAADAVGLTWGAPQTIDGAGANRGQYTSLAIVNGNPAISYYSATGSELRYVRSAFADGSGVWNSPAPVSLDAPGVVGQYTSLAVVNGDPAISYYDATNTNLKYIRATTVDGTGAWNAALTLDGAAPAINVGQWTSLAVVNGNPAISYYDVSNTALRYIRATNASGTAWGGALTVDGAGGPNVGQYTSLAVIAGNPAISYYSVSGADLIFNRATDVNGAAWGGPQGIDTGGNVGQYTSLAVINGNPAISYYRPTNSELRYDRSVAADGSGAWNAPDSVDAPGVVGQWTSLAQVSGQPAISYYDATNTNLKYARFF